MTLLASPFRPSVQEAFGRRGTQIRNKVLSCQETVFFFFKLFICYIFNEASHSDVKLKRRVFTVKSIKLIMWTSLFHPSVPRLPVCHLCAVGAVHTLVT